LKHNTRHKIGRRKSLSTQWDPGARTGPACIIADSVQAIFASFIISALVKTYTSRLGTAAALAFTSITMGKYSGILSQMCTTYTYYLLPVLLSGKALATCLWSEMYLEGEVYLCTATACQSVHQSSVPLCTYKSFKSKQAMNTPFRPDKAATIFLFPAVLRGPMKVLTEHVIGTLVQVRSECRPLQSAFEGRPACTVSS
jgi:hypothetical protein